MPLNHITTDALLDAAERLLAARGAEQVTAVEWDALAAAVAAAAPTPPPSNGTPDPGGDDAARRVREEVRDALNRDAANRPGAVRPAGSFLDGRGRTGLVLATDAGRFRLVVEPHP